MSVLHGCVIVCIVSLLSVSGTAQQAPSPSGVPGAAVAVTPGELVVDPPTLINLGFEWLIDGDANRNASVAVSYRKVGDAAWKIGLPLLRLQHERVTQPNVFNLVSPNTFAGSILDLEPDTAYEARFVMTDPDGIAGAAANAAKTVTVRTRPEPRPAPGGRPRVKAGDTLLMHAGTYAYRYEFYANQTTINATTTFEGTLLYEIRAGRVPASRRVHPADVDLLTVARGRQASPEGAVTVGCEFGKGAECGPARPVVRHRLTSGPRETSCVSLAVLP